MTERLLSYSEGNTVVERQSRIIRTTPEHTDFQNLVQLLDTELEIRDGELHPFYAQFNRLEGIRNVVVYFMDGSAVGCGAIRPFDGGTVEIKRMFVRPEYRARGIGVEILHELESWARELGYATTVLETGKKQPEAIRLYQKSGYEITEKFGPYTKTENSLCMKKWIGE